MLDKRDKAKATPGAANLFVDPGAFAPFIARLESEFERTLAERTAAEAN